MSASVSIAYSCSALVSQFVCIIYLLCVVKITALWLQGLSMLRSDVWMTRLCQDKLYITLRSVFTLDCRWPQTHMQCTPVVSWLKPNSPEKVVIVLAEISVAPVVPVPVKVESSVPPGGAQEGTWGRAKRGTYGKEGIAVRRETAEETQSTQWLCRETSEGKVPTYVTCKVGHVSRYFALICLST